MSNIIKGNGTNETHSKMTCLKKNSFPSWIFTLKERSKSTHIKYSSKQPSSLYMHFTICSNSYFSLYLSNTQNNTNSHTFWYNLTHQVIISEFCRQFLFMFANLFLFVFYNGISYVMKLCYFCWWWKPITNFVKIIIVLLA